MLRIAAVTTHAHVVGGAEVYLHRVLPALVSRGHAVGMWYASNTARDGGTRVAAGVRAVQLGEACGRSVPETLSAWQPDVVLLNSVSSTEIARRIVERYATVSVLHDYQGTCISGLKSHMFPKAAACSRPLGPGCLVHYFPRRCGGLNPLVMVRTYREQLLRRELLTYSDAVVTLSGHMRREAIANGVAADRAVHLPAFADTDGTADWQPGAPTDDSQSRESRQWHIGFIGRMERPKGAHLLVSALKHLQVDLGSRLLVTFAGDGRERAALEQRVADLPGVKVRFIGWISPVQRTELLRTLDLLVVPSIWPEPLGLVGLEAAAAGVPVVGFDTGGVSEWLHDGVTGRLVRRIGAGALADAVAECLESPGLLTSLRAGARDAAAGRSLEQHVGQLEQVLRHATNVRRAGFRPLVSTA